MCLLMVAETNPDSINFVPSKTYMKKGDPEWDIAYYLELDNDKGLVAIDQHFTGLENQNYSNTYCIVVGT